MKTFQEWFNQEYPNETIPEGTINGTWFAEHGLPMIVACTCCQTTMVIVSCMADEDGQIYCPDCAG